jgi:sarcosine oxidase, subunit alpha
MKNGRIENHPVLEALKPRRKIHFYFDGQKIEGFEGETIAAALLANGIRILRRHEESGSTRGIYCNIGHCMECRVTVDGNVNVRSCLTVIKEGMDVKSGEKLPMPFRKVNYDD